MNYLILFIFITIANTSYAGFFTEPFVGYKSETIKLADLSNDKIQINASEPNYGLKLGYRSLLGVDLNIAAEFSSGKATLSSQTNTNKFSHKMASVQLGVNALNIKMYLGSSFLNEFILEDSISLPGYKLSGPSFHAGLQYKPLSYLGLGLQYNLNQYNTIEGLTYSTGSKIETYYNKVDAQDYSFYLSTSF